MISALVAILLLVGCAEGSPRCSGNPRKLNGKFCASTTNYHDSHKGACGCGHSDTPFGWNQNNYVAAASQMVFDSGRKTWCGQKCGKCFRLTTTGGFVDGQGSAPAAGVSKVFMVTNLCPAEYPNMPWCAQNADPFSGGVNTHGYGYHFDLENGAHQIDRLQWNNPEVTVEEVNCDDRNDGMTPHNSWYSQCECHGH